MVLLERYFSILEWGYGKTWLGGLFLSLRYHLFLLTSAFFGNWWRYILTFMWKVKPKHTEYLYLSIILLVCTRLCGSKWWKYCTFVQLIQLWFFNFFMERENLTILYSTVWLLCCKTGGDYIHLLNVNLLLYDHFSGL